MRKIPRIIPCICTTHTPCSVVSSTYGMPVMIPSGDGKQTWFGIKCPMCGRGGFNTMRHKSVYKAIVAWNELQRALYQVGCRKVEYDTEYSEDYQYQDYEQNKWANDLPPGYSQMECSKSCKPDFSPGEWLEEVSE